MNKIKLNGAAEHSNKNKHNNKVSTINIVPQKHIHQADELQAVKTRVCKLEEDNQNMLRKFDELRITTNNKM